MKCLIALLVWCVEPALAEEAGTTGKKPQNPPFKEVQVLPVDEAAQQPDFVEFRKKLIVAVKKRDRAFLIEHLADDVDNVCAGIHGIQAFVSFYGLAGKTESGYEESFIWEEMQEFLALGGAFEDGEFQVPYVFTQFPDEFDAFEFGVIVGKNVNVREHPSADAPVIAKKSYTIVRIWDEATGPESKDPESGILYNWTQVGLPTGEIGYIYEKYVRLAINCRAGFQKRDGTWKMTFFVCGD